MNDIMVSVVCITYNHGKYIRKALESFVKQKTNFKFQIIVHDDASTDDTVVIMKEYENKYPELFKMIYQKENQHSKGVEIFPKYILPLIRGKYVALCEGDDYWCDENKLQLQVDVLEKDLDINLVVHNTIYINEKGDSTNRLFIENNRVNEGYIEEKDMVDLRCGVHTSSKMFRISLFERYWNELPCFAKNTVVGDLPINLYSAINGKVYYINKVMSCYRLAAIGSWNIRRYQLLKQHKYNEYASINENLMNIYIKFDEYTNNKFHNILAPYIKNEMYTCFVMSGKTYKYFTKRNFEYFCKLSFKQKLKVFYGIFRKDDLIKQSADDEVRNNENWFNKS